MEKIGRIRKRLGNFENICTYLTVVGNPDTFLTGL